MQGLGQVHPVGVQRHLDRRRLRPRIERCPPAKIQSRKGSPEPIEPQHTIVEDCPGAQPPHLQAFCRREVDPEPQVGVEGL
jgi:hypothetical protein